MNKKGQNKTQYDFMRECENNEEDAFFPEDWINDVNKTDREKYFEFYDDIKTNIKEDW